MCYTVYFSTRNLMHTIIVALYVSVSLLDILAPNHTPDVRIQVHVFCYLLAMKELSAADFYMLSFTRKFLIFSENVVWISFGVEYRLLFSQEISVWIRCVFEWSSVILFSEFLWFFFFYLVCETSKSVANCSAFRMPGK